MFIAAIIIYIVLAIITGPFWPLDLLGGKGGLLGYLLVIGWGALLIAGLNS
jgi:hypothetical protein